MKLKNKMEKVKARKSFGEDYECEYQWDCSVQCGDSGVVFGKERSYTTAFFEAFPNNPSTFLRGEGETIKDAEQQCWSKYQNVLLCNHEMERRNRTDGYGYCKHCSYSSMVFEPLTKCKICKKPTNYSSDIKNNHYCEKHHRLIPHKLKHKLFDSEKKTPRKLKKIAKQIATKRFREDGIMGKVILSGKYVQSFKCGGYIIGMLLGVKRYVRRNVKK